MADIEVTQQLACPAIYNELFKKLNCTFCYQRVCLHLSNVQVSVQTGCDVRQIK